MRYVLIEGNLEEGLFFHGPFYSRNQALSAVDEGGPWQVVELFPPDSTDFTVPDLKQATATLREALSWITDPTLGPIDVRNCATAIREVISILNPD